MRTALSCCGIWVAVFSLVTAGLSKLARPQQFADALDAAGVAARSARLLPFALGGAELLFVAALFLGVSCRRWLLAYALLVACATAASSALYESTKSECGCGLQVIDSALPLRYRNAILVAASLFAALVCRPTVTLGRATAARVSGLAVITCAVAMWASWSGGPSLGNIEIRAHRLGTELACREAIVEVRNLGDSPIDVALNALSCSCLKLIGIPIANLGPGEGTSWLIHEDDPGASAGASVLVSIKARPFERSLEKRVTLWP